MVQGRRPIYSRVLVTLTLLATGISAYQPADWLTWFLETFPVLIGLPILLLTAKRFPLTPLVYTLLFLHGLILLVGAHSTYAEAPIGYWLKDLLGFERNPWDRVGHIAQGFVPAMVTREVLLRTTPLRRGGWLFFIVVCICLAISAFYELIEWWSALAFGGGADAFLGTQGDVWDTQWDMFLALCGATSAQVLLGRLHDRQMTKLQFTIQA
ncbi:MAG: DUF2238 domain-containing protein [Planctomycetes bacterium]|nr:DUF2238 domain-containing protein [Planctomycetota bacterium]NUQ34423.1 DUF2238 domain-containing protein [Planctomycetaceae bacterium]